MKKSAILVNTSRGPIVDEAALIAALKNRTIAHAGLDVYDKEPVAPGHPLTKLDNVTLIPHLGYVVEDSYRHFYAGTIEDIEAWLDGKPINLINPDALKKRRRDPSSSNRGTSSCRQCNEKPSATRCARGCECRFRPDPNVDEVTASTVATAGDRHDTIYAAAAPGPQLQGRPAARKDDGDDQALHGLGRCLAPEGQLVGGEKLAAGGVRHIKVKDGKPVASDGPYAEAKDVIGGYFVDRGQGRGRGRGDRPDCPHLRYPAPTGSSSGRSTP